MGTTYRVVASNEGTINGPGTCGNFSNAGLFTAYPYMQGNFGNSGINLTPCISIPIKNCGDSITVTSIKGGCKNGPCCQISGATIIVKIADNGLPQGCPGITPTCSKETKPVVLDLSIAAFEQLAPLSLGKILVDMIA
jgi:hypothetical protein